MKPSTFLRAMKLETEEINNSEEHKVHFLIKIVNVKSCVTVWPYGHGYQDKTKFQRKKFYGLKSWHL